MKRVIVKKDDQYYVCKSVDDFKFKCGKCLFGNIYGIEKPSDLPNDCKRCGAKHHSTTWGSNYFNLQVFEWGS